MTRLVLILTVLAVLLTPGAAFGAYNHLSACESSLRGGGGSDNDVHALGVLTGATSFGGWGTYWHTDGGSVYVYGKFNYAGGVSQWYLGHCWGGDWSSDSIG
jgi:hypothetical protein